MTRLTQLLVAGLLLTATAPVSAQAPRQSYSNYWVKHKSYFYKYYNHRKAPNAPLERHLVVYRPSQPQYFYYFNPQKKTFWGRYDRTCGLYSTLPVAARRESLAAIRPDAFPEPGPMPPIPGCEDRTQMEAPLGFPPDESKEVTAVQMRILLAADRNQVLPRQAFSDWCQNGGYFFRTFFYQPVNGGAYKAHFCVWYPDQEKAQHFAIFNPYTEKYWARYDRLKNGYSVLAPANQEQRLRNIAPTNWSPVVQLFVPEAGDRVAMQQPPRDLPQREEVETLPLPPPE